MTEDQFNRAVEISGRLQSLEKVKGVIRGTSTHCLSYLEKGSPCSTYVMQHISSILDKHDKMIRAEIDEEIEKLKKEIKEL